MLDFDLYRLGYPVSVISNGMTKTITICHFLDLKRLEAEAHLENPKYKKAQKLYDKVRFEDVKPILKSCHSQTVAVDTSEEGVQTEAVDPV